MNAVIDRIFGRIATKQTQLKSSLWDDYKEQVLVPLSNGAEVDSDAVEQFLEALGYDEAKLRADVVLLQKRYQWVEQAAAAKVFEEEAAGIQKKLDLLQTEYEQWHEQFRAKCIPLNVRMGEIKHMTSAPYISELLNHPLDANLIARQQAIARQCNLLRIEATEIKQHPLLQSEAEYTATYNRAVSLKQSYANRTDYDAEMQIKQAKVQIDEYKPAMARLEHNGLSAKKKRLVEIEREIQSLEAQMQDLNAKALLP